MARYSPAPPHFSIGKTVNMRDQVIPKTGGILQAKRLLLGAIHIQQLSGMDRHWRYDEQSRGFEAVFHTFNQCRRFEAVDDAMIERR